MGRYRTFEVYTDRDLKKRGCTCAEIDFYCYLIRHEKSHMSGLFFMPLHTMAKERETSEKAIKKLISSLNQKGRLCYDDKEEIIWLPQMAPWQIKSGGRRENRYSNICNHLLSMHSILVDAFYEKWGCDFSDLTSEIERLHVKGNNTFNVNGNDKPNVTGNVLCSLFSVNCSSSPKEQTSLLREEPAKKTRAKQNEDKNQTEINIKEEKNTDDILNTCSRIRFSYLDAVMPPATKKIRAQAKDVSTFAQDQFSHNQWENSGERILAYIGLLYEAFMNYNGEERKPDGTDFILDSDYHFAGFHSRLSRWAEKVERVRDRKDRRVYVVLNEPMDLLKFASDSDSSNDAMARVDAFKRRNKDKAEEIERFRRLSWDGVSYDEYKERERAGLDKDGESDGTA